MMIYVGSLFYALISPNGGDVLDPLEGLIIRLVEVVGPHEVDVGFV